MFKFVSGNIGNPQKNPRIFGTQPEIRNAYITNSLKDVNVTPWTTIDVRQNREVMCFAVRLV